MAHAYVTATLMLRLETEDGQRLTAAQLQEAKACLEQAILTRLMGDGFLPDDLLLDSWDIRFATTGESH